MNNTGYNVSKWFPRTTLLGALLVLIATVLHPITIDPWNADLPIHFITEHKHHWMWDHALMATGITLWFGGLACCFALFKKDLRLTSLVVALFISSIAIWLVTIAFELGGMPITVERLHSEPGHRLLAESMFASVLISGYLALIPAWLGIMVGAQSKWGILSGSIGILGIVFCIAQPILWILLLTNALPFLWTVIFAWRCLKTR